MVRAFLTYIHLLKYNANANDSAAFPQIHWTTSNLYINIAVLWNLKQPQTPLPILEIINNPMIKINNLIGKLNTIPLHRRQMMTSIELKNFGAPRIEMLRS